MSVGQQSQTVLVTATHKEGSLHMWDPDTGALLASYRGCATSPNCTTMAGSSGLVSAQREKNTLHFWSWEKVSNSTA